MQLPPSSMLVALIALLVLVAVAWWAGPGWRPRPLTGVVRSRPWLLGHRGARGSLPENTVRAFALAFAHLDGIETDVQRTADGELVLWHDLELQGLDIRSTPFATLARFEPTLAKLSELFALAREHPGTVLNLEMKTTRKLLRSGRLERDLVDAVRASGLADRVIVSSFDPFALARLRLLAPGLRTALLTDEQSHPLLSSGFAARWLHVDALHPKEVQVDDALLARCRGVGLPVHVWTVNDPSRMRELVRLGVGGLIGDDPPTLAGNGKEPAREASDEAGDRERPDPVRGTTRPDPLVAP